MEPKKLTETQVRLMLFIHRSRKKSHTRLNLMNSLDIDRNTLSLAVRPLQGFFIQVDYEKKGTAHRQRQLISLTEGGVHAIKGWILANRRMYML